MIQRKRFDVCVVGSGPGGGIAPYALARAGLKVALVEAGPRLRADIDFGTHAWPYEINERTHNVGRDDSPRLRFEANHFTPAEENIDAYIPGHSSRPCHSL
ncbi:MAG: FAD-binding protein [Blastocatellia bacterium]